MQKLLTAIGLLLMGAGVVALLRPGSVRNMNLPLDEALQGLGSGFRLERYYYRYHKFTGPLTFLGGVLLCYSALVLHTSRSLQEPWLMLQEAGVIIFAVFGVGIMLLGLAVSIRPSVLKPLEQRSNLVITRESLKELLLKLRLGLVGWSVKHPRIFGLLALLAGVVIVSLALGWI